MHEGKTKPEIIFVLGGPGSGKGTQCDLIVKKYEFANLLHISTGDVLREVTKKDNPQNREIIQLMKEGKMVPSKPLVKLLKDYIERLGNGFVYLVDGFPRNQDNMDAWRQVIGQAFDIKFLLYFEVSDNEMRNRLLNRGKTSGRADDNIQTIEKRIKTFYSDTKPMLEQFKKYGGKIVKIDGNTYIDRVAWNVCIELKKNKVI